MPHSKRYYTKTVPSNFKKSYTGFKRQKYHLHDSMFLAVADMSAVSDTGFRTFGKNLVGQTFSVCVHAFSF